MGYRMTQMESDFRIPYPLFQEVLDGLKEAARKENAGGWGSSLPIADMAEFQLATTLRQAMTMCRWNLGIDDQGHVYKIDFKGENLYDDEQVLEAIAWAVEDGSYIEMFGEDGQRWRWVFNNGSMKVVDAIITWEARED